MNLAHPYGFDQRGRTAEAADERHVRDLIECVLFTAPGERVMNPSFGSGAARLVFAPNSVALAGATQILVQATLQQFLAGLIAVQGVQVEADESTLAITVQYALAGSSTIRVETFQRPLGDGA